MNKSSGEDTSNGLHSMRGCVAYTLISSVVRIKHQRTAERDERMSKCRRIERRGALI